jgi:hypothetical protein
MGFIPRSDIRPFPKQTYTVCLVCQTPEGPLYRILESKIKTRKQAFRFALVWSLSWDRRLTGLPEGKKSIIINTGSGMRLARIKCTKKRYPYENN